MTVVTVKKKNTKSDLQAYNEMQSLDSCIKARQRHQHSLPLCIKVLLALFCITARNAALQLF